MHRWTTRLLQLAVAIAGLMLVSCAAAATQAPEFSGIAHWINSPPLTMSKLRGKVVLIDFWTYSCINCLRTLPYVTRWYDTYKDQGLVVVGVHSPEFEFEKSESNVERAVKHFGIRYPVAMDNDMATWNAWSNQFWPAEYLVDRNGNVVLHHYGEGRYAEMENAIRKELAMAPMSSATTTAPNLAGIRSPEMYFGLDRVRNLANIATLPRLSHDYAAPSKLPVNQFALDGHWKLTGTHAEATGDDAGIRLHFDSGKVYMVASSETPVTLAITVDGHAQPPVTVHESRLYTLYDGSDYGPHVIMIGVPKAGLRAYTFTFG